MIAKTPASPYYAVIFSSVKAVHDDPAYMGIAVKMEKLARLQKGFSNGVAWK